MVTLPKLSADFTVTSRPSKYSSIDGILTAHYVSSFVVAVAVPTK
jgi:hypothetical protein